MKKILGTVILSGYLFVSCGSVDKFDDFKLNFNSKEYESCFSLYDENVGNKKFKGKVEEFCSDYLISFEKLLNKENYSEIEKEINVLSRFSSDSKIDKLRSEIEEYKISKIQEKDEEELVKEEIKEDLEVEESLGIGQLDDLLEGKIESQKQVNKYGDFEYKRYNNERYGYSLVYPSFLVKKIPAQNMSGLTMTNPEETVSLSTFAINNLFNKTIEEIYHEKLNSLDNYGYTYLGKTSCVVTWTEREENFYQYTVVGAGSQNGFVVKSPKEDTVIFDEVITEIYNSFKSGDLTNSH